MPKRKNGSSWRGGRPRLSVDARRTRSITVSVKPGEWAALAERAKAKRLPLGRFVREAVLRVLETAPVPPPEERAFRVAGALTALARDLDRLAIAAEEGRAVGVLPGLLRRMEDAAHIVGLHLLGVSPDAP